MIIVVNESFNSLCLENDVGCVVGVRCGIWQLELWEYKIFDWCDVAYLLKVCYVFYMQVDQIVLEISHMCMVTVV